MLSRSGLCWGIFEGVSVPTGPSDAHCLPPPVQIGSAATSTRFGSDLFAVNLESSLHVIDVIDDDFAGNGL